MIRKVRFLMPYLLACILALSAQSCFDAADYDFDKLSDKIDWTPELTVPIGRANYSLNDLLVLNNIDTDILFLISRINSTHEDLLLRDTIKNLDVDDADKILKAKILMSIENGYPYTINVDHIFMTDEQYYPIDTIHIDCTFKGAEIFPEGNGSAGKVDSTTIRKMSCETDLNSKQIANLKESRNLILTTRIITSSSENAKPEGQEELKWSLSIQAQINPTK